MFNNIKCKDKNNDNIKKEYIILKEYIINNNYPFYYLENLEQNIPLIIAYDNITSLTDPLGGSIQNFINGLDYYDYNYIIVGSNQKWKGWYGRLLEYIKILKLLPKDQIVIFSDARDVIINGSKQLLLENYNKLIKEWNDIDNNKIIFGTEYSCGVGPMWYYKPKTIFTETKKIKDAPSLYIYKEDVIYEWYLEFKKLFKSNNSAFNLNLDDTYEMIYLNFGLMCGKSDKILEMFIFFNMQPNDDDQHLASEYLLTFSNKIILDYKNILFSNTGYKHSLMSCTCDTLNSPFYNKLYNNHHVNKYKLLTYLNINNNITNDIYTFNETMFEFKYKTIISTPSFIQSPGKDWNSYNSLIGKYKYSNKENCYYYNSEDTVTLLK
jgi:hypothetical protein